MNIYNVTYPYGSNRITVITLASNIFDAKKQIEIRKLKTSKKHIKIDVTTTFGMKDVKVEAASDEDIKDWLQALEKINDQEQLKAVQAVLCGRTS